MKSAGRWNIICRSIAGRQEEHRVADSRSLRSFAKRVSSLELTELAFSHRTGDVLDRDLTESTLLEYLRFQSGLQPRPSGSTINARIAVADRALRNEFPDAPCQVAQGFHHAYLRRRPMGLARPRWAISRLRVKEPKRSIVPLSIDEVARFWSSFRTTRDLAIVGLMLLQGLRSAEVLALNPDDLVANGFWIERGAERRDGTVEAISQRVLNWRPPCAIHRRFPGTGRMC